MSSIQRTLQSKWSALRKEHNYTQTQRTINVPYHALNNVAELNVIEEYWIFKTVSQATVAFPIPKFIKITWRP